MSVLYNAVELKSDSLFDCYKMCLCYAVGRIMLLDAQSTGCNWPHPLALAINKLRPAWFFVNSTLNNSEQRSKYIYEVVTT